MDGHDSVDGVIMLVWTGEILNKFFLNVMDGDEWTDSRGKLVPHLG